MTAVMGIDGGGSTIRVVIVTPDLVVLGQSIGPTANPSLIGREAAAHVIHVAMREALDNAKLNPGEIRAVGIGVAGAAASHSEDWLRGVVSAILPKALIAPSADYETALVGAFGQRVGVLVLAGTGSLAYGVNEAGVTALIGGWGYLLGDEGSGYWLGNEGLRAITKAVEGRGPATMLTERLLNALNLSHPRELVPWIYRANRTREIAALAPLVLELAATDVAAQRIVLRGAEALAEITRTVIRQLNMKSPAVAFAGGLLSESNPLSAALCSLLGLSAIPTPRYPPVIGAALLALGLVNESDHAD